MDRAKVFLVLKGLNQGSCSDNSGELNNVEPEASPSGLDKTAVDEQKKYPLEKNPDASDEDTADYVGTTWKFIGGSAVAQILPPPIYTKYEPSMADKEEK